MYFNKINCQLFLLGFGSVLTTNSIMSFPVLKLVGCHFCAATLLNKVHFSLSTTFVQEAFFHGINFARGDISARRHFCKSLHLHGDILQCVTFARRCSFTEIFMHCEIFKQLVIFERSKTFACFQFFLY